MAQQDAEKARFLVEKAEQHKKAAIVTAEGDSKAAELIAKALSEVGDGQCIENKLISTSLMIILFSPLSAQTKKVLSNCVVSKQLKKSPRLCPSRPMWPT